MARHHRRRWYQRVNFKLLAILVLVTGILGTAAVVGHYARKRIIASRELAAGKEALQKEQWAKACLHLRTYLSKCPNDVEMLGSYAKAHLAVRPRKKENIGAAVGAYRQLLHNRPGDREACEELARLYFSVGDHGQVEHVARQRLAVAPDDARARIWLGRALIAQRKFDEATESMTPFVEAHPDQVEAYQLLSAAVLRGDPSQSRDAALAWFDRAVQSNPESADARARRAMYHLVVMRDAAKARADLEAAGALATTDAQVLLTLVQLWLELGDSKQAQVRLEALKQLDEALLSSSEVPREDVTYLALKAEAELARQEGSAKQGAAVADRALEALHGERRTMFLPYATELYLANGQIERAEWCVEQFRAETKEAKEQNDALPEQLGLLNAVLANAKGDFYTAINQLEPFASSPRNLQVWRVLAYAYERTDQPRRAVPLLEKYVSRRPADRPTLRVLARLCLAIGNPTSAFKVAQQAEKADPDDIAPKLLRIEAAIRSAPMPLSEAVRAQLAGEIDSLAKAHPKSGDVRLLQAELAVACGQPDEAVAALERAVKETDRSIAAAMQLVDLLASRGQNDKAVAVCKTTIDDQPQIASPRIALAQLESRLGRKEDARRTLDQAVAALAGAEKVRAMDAFVGYLAANDERAGAIELLKKICAERTGDVRPRLAILNLPEVQKDALLAQQLVDEVRGIEGDKGLRWQLEQARIWRRSDRWKESQEQIKEFLGRCVEGDPTWGLPVLMLGEVHEALGKSDPAEKVYRKFVDSCAGYPGHAAIAARLLGLLERQRRFTDAAEVLKQVPGKPGQLSRHRVTLSLARGEYESAAAELQQQITAAPEDATSRVVLARLVYVRDKDAAAAIKLLDEAMKLSPDLLSAASTKVEILLADGRKDEALDFVNAEVQRRDDFAAYVLRGRYYIWTNQLEAAEKDYLHLTEFKDLAEPAYAELGLFYQLVGRPEQAVATWRAGLKARPDSAGLQRLLIRGLVAGSQPADRQEGMASLDTMLREVPDDADLLSVRAGALMSQNKPESTKEALAIYARLAELAPRNPLAHTILIRHAASQGDLAKANELAKRALGANPDDVELLVLRASIESDLHNPREAKALAQMALTADPKNVFARGVLVNLAIQTGKLDEADAVVAEALEIAPASEDALLWRCRVLRARQQPEKAVELLEAYRRTETGRGSIRVLLALVDLYQMQKDTAASEACLKEAEQMMPGIVEVFLARIQSWAVQGRLDEMVAAVSERRKERPNETQVLSAAAQVLASAASDKYVREAVPLFEQLVALNPGGIEANLGLAISAHRIGDLDKAEKAYRKLLELDPNHPTALNNLAWILCEDRKKPQEAIELAKAGVARYPADSHLLSTRGVAYFRLSSFAEARKDFEACLTLEHTPPATRAKTLLCLGRIHAKENEMALARSSVEQALSMDRQGRFLTDEERAEAEQLVKACTQ